MQNDFIIIRLSWNGHLERWILKDFLGGNLFELPDCGNFRSYYGLLDKTKEYIVKMPLPEVKEVIAT
jgi:hypothetical protein